MDTTFCDIINSSDNISDCDPSKYFHLEAISGKGDGGGVFGLSQKHLLPVGRGKKWNMITTKPGWL